MGIKVGEGPTPQDREEVSAGLRAMSPPWSLLLLCVIGQVFQPSCGSVLALGNVMSCLANSNPLKMFLHLFIWSVHTYKDTCSCVQQSEDNFYPSHVASGDQIQVIRLGGKHLYLRAVPWAHARAFLSFFLPFFLSLYIFTCTFFQPLFE